jgi:Protein of unknown function (DUF3574)
MNKFLMNKFLVLALIVTSAVTPMSYGFDQTALFHSVAAVARNVAESQEQGDGELFVRTELFFGRNKPDGTKVSRRDWERFLDDVITPRFPDGLTVLEGIGRFLNSRGQIEQERTFVLILFYPLEAQRDKSLRIEEIREIYKLSFQQQSVLRVDDPMPVRVSF